MLPLHCMTTNYTEQKSNHWHRDVQEKKNQVTESYTQTHTHIHIHQIQQVQNVFPWYSDNLEKGMCEPQKKEKKPEKYSACLNSTQFFLALGYNGDPRETYSTFLLLIKTPVTIHLCPQ